MALLRVVLFLAVLLALGGGGALVKFRAQPLRARRARLNAKNAAMVQATLSTVPVDL